ncbi:MAG TPA: hypothetical protein GX008_08510 [Firmicutes bacterium]|jgi:6-phospho-beta-glucosidase|nr:hypothetical protein [Bacillota bacterium]
MKIAILGAAGVRTPQLVRRLLRSTERLGLKEIALMDIAGTKLELMKNVIDDIAPEHHGVTLSATTDVREACAYSAFVIFTMRVGDIAARIIDEQVPLRYNVLGQETTGPGGFAMALRTIPVVLEYVDIIKEVAPQAWVVNLTNPSGIITQAVTDRGFGRIVGICDGPTELLKATAQAVGREVNELWFDYYGINHLGWVGGVQYKGEELLPSILQDDEALEKVATHSVEPDLIKAVGLLPNEYLIFFYKHQSVVQNIQRAQITRSQQIDSLNQELFSQLAEIADGKSEERPRDAYFRYLRKRSGSYFQVERQGELNREERPAELSDAALLEPEGYSEIAVQVLEALLGLSPQVIPINVRNNGALPCLDADDVVEVQSLVDSNGVHPFTVKVEVPPHARTLLQRVKGYERLTIEAVRQGSYSLALQALSCHPLVPDLATAKAILDAYLAEHGDYMPELR